jgi:hypothetical protein
MPSLCYGQFCPAIGINTFDRVMELFTTNSAYNSAVVCELCPFKQGEFSERRCGSGIPQGKRPFDRILGALVLPV